MKDLNKMYCSGCKNNCTLANPKCENGRMLAEKVLAGEDPLAGRCTMCDKKCPYDNLECSTGRTMAIIKGWK